MTPYKMVPPVAGTLGSHLAAAHSAEGCMGSERILKMGSRVDQLSREGKGARHGPGL
jgi:hypothetical protein